MTSILEGSDTDTAGAVADMPAGPAAAEACPPAHAVLRFTQALTAALDRLQPVPAWSMTPAEQRQALVELAQQEARLRELRLRVLVAADRNQVGADTGATSTPAWLAHQTKTTRQAAFSDLHLAQALDGDFTAARQALAAGLIDVDKALVIIKAVGELSDEHDDLPEGTRAKAEAHLVELAAEFDAPTLRKLASGCSRWSVRRPPTPPKAGSWPTRKPGPAARRI